MLNKRRIVLKKTTQPDDGEKKIIPLPQYQAFMNEIRSEGLRKEPGILRAWYERIFGVFPPWSEHPYELVKAKLSYELVRQDYEKAGVPLPESVRRNYEATRDFNIGGLSSGIKQLISCAQRTLPYSSEELQQTKRRVVKPKEERPMKTKEKKAKKSVEKGPKVYETIIRVLEENRKNRLPDERLAILINREHPDKKQYNVKEVRGLRAKFNRGQDWGMTGAPSPLSIEYDKKGQPVNGKISRVEKKPTPASKRVIVLKRK